MPDKSSSWNLFLHDALAEVADPELRLLLIGPAAAASPEGDARYERSHLHAHGGIGQVWLARDRQLERDVALKELKPAQADSLAARMRFLREAKITSRLEHPGIVPVYELRSTGVTATSESPYYTMRFVRGRTFHEAVRQHHQDPSNDANPRLFRELVQALVGVAKTVAYAHTRGVVHRDLKGQNVVLGPFGEVLVLDWGLAKVLDGDFFGDAGMIDLDSTQTPEGVHDLELTHEGQIVGTPAYAAPEQAAGRLGEIDARTDVYGLGAMLYDLLAGKAPYTGKDSAEVLKAVVERAPPPPEDIVRGVPRALNAVCMKAMARERNDRYASASEFAEELERWLADEPVHAAPESAFERAGRWLRRHRTAVRAGSLIAVLTIVGLSGSLYVVNRERRDKAAALDDAEANLVLARKSVDRFLTEAGQSPELATKGLDSFRRSLLSAAREFYTQLSRRHMARPDIRREAAIAGLRVGYVSVLMGDRSTALDDYERAIEGLRAVSAERPEDAEAAERLADALYDCAQILIQNGRMPRAVELVEEALERRGRLSAERPTDLERLSALGQTHLGLGQIFEAQKDLDRAIAANKEAVVLFQRVANERPQDVKSLERLAIAEFNVGTQQMNARRFDEALAGLKQALEHWRRAKGFGELSAPQHPAGALMNLGKIAYATKDLASAKQRFQECIDELEPLIQRYPLRTAYRAEYVTALSAMSAVVSSNEQALAWGNKAIAAQRQLILVEPDVPRHRQTLGMALLNVSSAEFQFKRLPAALAAAQESRTLFESLASRTAVLPELEDHRAQAAVNVAATLSALGRHREALAVAEEGLKLHSDRAVRLQAARALYLARAGDHRAATTAIVAAKTSPYQGDGEWQELQAEVWAVASGAVRGDSSLTPAKQRELTEQYAAKAMAHLREGARLGRYKEAASIRELSEEEDFLPLRSRADFQAFLNEFKAAETK